ncbi:MAG: sulfotransferase domain-containing protein [Balneolales bacterium]
MNILQISAPKSGSYWLYTVLIRIMEKKGMEHKSFIQKQPEFRCMKDLTLSFNGQPGVDMIDIEDEGFFYRVSSVVKEPIADLEQYVHSLSIAWTHSSFCTNSFEAFSLFDKKICIIRDPRDRALSSAKFAFTSYMRQHYPSSYSSPKEYLSGEYERLLEQWVWHVGNYLLYKDKLEVHFVFYDRLLSDFDHELHSLLNYLGITLSVSEQKEITDAVTFSAMKGISPGHLQKGESGKWAMLLNASQKELAVEKAGKLMRMLNFPLEAEQKNFPEVPHIIPKDELEELLEQIEWQGLFQ